MKFPKIKAGDEVYLPWKTANKCRVYPVYNNDSKLVAVYETPSKGNSVYIKNELPALYFDSDGKDYQGNVVAYKALPQTKEYIKSTLLIEVE